MAILKHISCLQVLYQIGVFISRTVGGILPWMPAVSILAGLQVLR